MRETYKSSTGFFILLILGTKSIDRERSGKSGEYCLGSTRFKITSGTDFRLFRFSIISFDALMSPMNQPQLAMTPTALTKMTLPVEKEMQAAVQGQRAMAAYLATRSETQHLQIFDDKNQAHQVEPPTTALRLLLDILAELAEGNAVKVVPIHAELTTQQAADLLNVSRPHLVKMLVEGRLPFHKTGKHRRVRFADLMQFKAHRDQASEDAMAELALQAQKLALGYE